MHSAEPLDAFRLDRFPAVLHAFNIAFYSCLTFSKEPIEGAINPETDFHITFEDSGGSVLLEKVRNSACEIAIALHREHAQAIVSIANDQFTDLLYAIADAARKSQKSL